MFAPSLELGPPPTPSPPSECVPPPPRTKGGGTHLPTGDDWRKRLALCLLCGAGYPEGGETHGGQYQGRGHCRRDQLRLEVRRHGKILNWKLGYYEKEKVS